MQRHLRLRSSQDFDRLRRLGHTWRHPFVILSLVPNSLPHNRYGFVTSRQLGKAVVRSRARRLLREAVRHVHPCLQVGYDVVLIARPPMVGQSSQAISSVVTDLFKRARLFQPCSGDHT